MKNILTIIVLIVAIWFGWHYYVAHKQEIITAKDTVVETTTEGIDLAIKNAISSVDKISPIYYYNNRSYGASATSNICLDTTQQASIGAVIAIVQKYTKAVTCTVDPNFPSKSFTITAPSFLYKGQYYCTDQSGFVGLIPDITKPGAFKVGLSCK